jgi:hypothetical protein
MKGVLQIIYTPLTELKSQLPPKNRKSRKSFEKVDGFTTTKCFHSARDPDIRSSRAAFFLLATNVGTAELWLV